MDHPGGWEILQPGGPEGRKVCLLLGKSKEHKGDDTADDHGGSQDQKLTELTVVSEESSPLTSQMKNLL